MYLIKLKVWNEKDRCSTDKIFAIKTKSTLDIIKNDNFDLFLEENEAICQEEGSIDIRDEKHIFKDSNCGIFRVS